MTLLFKEHMKFVTSTSITNISTLSKKTEKQFTL